MVYIDKEAGGGEIYCIKYRKIKSFYYFQ